MLNLKTYAAHEKYRERDNQDFANYWKATVTGNST